MNARGREVAFRRILVALDASAPSLAALEAAATVAAKWEAELLGMFVEDINLLQLATLPFTREVGFPSAIQRSIEPQDVERRLRVQARLSEQALARVAGRFNLRWSFRAERGQIVTQLLEMAREVDLIVLGLRGRQVAGRMPRGAIGQALMSAATQSVLLMPEGMRIESPLLVIYDGSPSSRQALAVALRQAQDGLIVLIAAGPAERAALAREAAALVADRGLAADYRSVGADPADLLRALRDESNGTLILGADQPLALAEFCKPLLDLDCAVLLIR